MKQALRSRAAAAAILVALCGGAAFVATPAVAGNFVLPSYAPHEMLQRFEVLGSPTPGRSVTFRVHGLPGGQATVNVPGIASTWELPEVAPGLYQREFPLAPVHDASAIGRAVATLSVGGRAVEARVGTAGLSVNPPFEGTVASGGYVPPRPGGVVARDRRGPDISDVSPANGERVRDRRNTRITARFSDDSSGVGSVNLRVDGRDVTNASRIDNGRVDYRADLAPGRHTAELAVRDRAGNLTRRSWTFEVDDGRRYGYQGWDDGRRW